MNAKNEKTATKSVNMLVCLKSVEGGLSNWKTAGTRQAENSIADAERYSETGSKFNQNPGLWRLLPSILKIMAFLRHCLNQ